MQKEDRPCRHPFGRPHRRYDCSWPQWVIRAVLAVFTRTADGGPFYLPHLADDVVSGGAPVALPRRRRVIDGAVVDGVRDAVNVDGGDVLHRSAGGVFRQPGGATRPLDPDVVPGAAGNRPRERRCAPGREVVGAGKPRPPAGPLGFVEGPQLPGAGAPGAVGLDLHGHRGGGGAAAVGAVAAAVGAVAAALVGDTVAVVVDAVADLVGTGVDVAATVVAVNVVVAVAVAVVVVAAAAVGAVAGTVVVAVIVVVDDAVAVVVFAVADLGRAGEDVVVEVVAVNAVGPAVVVEVGVAAVAGEIAGVGGVGGVGAGGGAPLEVAAAGGEGGEEGEEGSAEDVHGGSRAGALAGRGGF